ncbi:MAG: SMP-30/gluconolactonase/LRE family protein [Ilumatobacteraceae bacterium]
MSDMTLVTDGLHFPEGPVPLRDGRVLVVEIQTGTITAVSPDGAKEVVASPGGGPNGAAIGPDGKLYVCNNGGFEWHDMNGFLLPGEQPEDYLGGRIQRIDLDTGDVEDLYTECNGFGLRGPNDIVFDAHGGFWFTDHGKVRPREMDRGGLYYATTDGSSITEVVHPLASPNGVGLSPDGAVVYVAETHTGRLWSWDVESPGVLAAPAVTPDRLLYDFPGYQLLDSLAVDGDGNICIATLITGAITVVSPAGELVGVHPVPEYDPLVTNVCFGGPDHRTAYVTASGTGRLYSMTWPHTGLQLQYER